MMILIFFPAFSLAGERRLDILRTLDCMQGWRMLQHQGEEQMKLREDTPAASEKLSQGSVA